MRSSFFKRTEPTVKKERVRLNGRFVTFTICLIVSVFFWLLLSLSREYSIVLNFPVEYVNLPKDKLLSNELPSTVDMEVKARGYSLLPYKVFSERELIRIDLKDARPHSSKDHFFLLTNSRTDKITSQFSSSVKVIKISPDTIYLDFNKKSKKLVPVQSQLSIECEDQYELTDSIRLKPSFIEISGTPENLDKIDTLKTAVMDIKKVKASLLLKLNILKDPKMKQVDFSQSTVQAVVNVAKYTETSLELPVEVENLPAGYGLKTFPDKVVLKFKVKFSDYGKINAALFRAVVDYSKIEPGNNKLRVHVTKQPAGVRGLKLSTEKVEYIIRK